MKDIPLEQPFARGRTADIHAWEDGTVLKRFHNWFSREDIEYEHHHPRSGGEFANTQSRVEGVRAGLSFRISETLLPPAPRRLGRVPPLASHCGWRAPEREYPRGGGVAGQAGWKKT